MTASSGASSEVVRCEWTPLARLKWLMRRVLRALPCGARRRELAMRVPAREIAAKLLDARAFRRRAFLAR